jgi:4-hydroxy-3-polyprenylbenzoate decarboxylase
VNALKTASQRLIVGISGASGIVYGVRLLELLRDTAIETHLVLSKAAQITLASELDRRISEIQALADVVHPVNDLGASISSGSFKTLGMIVAPCSMRSLAEIANGMSTTLLTRAADVVLKERRRLVLLVRETPLHLGHLRNMTAIIEMGAIVYPPVPAMYAKPKTIDAMIDHTLGRVLDLFDIEIGTVHRWAGIRATVAQPDEPGSIPPVVIVDGRA